MSIHISEFAESHAVSGIGTVAASSGIFALPVLIAVVWIFSAYARAFGRTILLSTPRQRSSRAYPPAAEPEHAYRSYFFGPAMRDVRGITTDGVRAMVQTTVDLYRRVTDEMRVRIVNKSGRWWAIPLGLLAFWFITYGAFNAIVIGTVLGGVLAVVILTLQVIARAVGAVLRAFDTALLRSKGLDGMLCPTCYRRVAYPAYRCGGCGHLHVDIRPGTHGVLRRRCACDNSRPMPTLIILGSHKLPAFCTHCNTSMSEAVGRSREMILPLFGGVSAGKTQLMAAMMKGLVDDPRRRARPADEETQHAYDVMRTVFENGNPEFSKTKEALPRAHAVHTGSGRSRRLLHLFDTDGKRFTERGRIEELGYAAHARDFLFVIDVQAVPEFWNQLSAEESERLDRFTVSTVSPELVFQLTVQTLMEMGVPLRRSRLIVAISKADLFQNTAIMSGRRANAESARSLLVKQLGLGSLERSMRHEFGRVDYVFTAAIPDERGAMPANIRTLTSLWLEGRRFPTPGWSRALTASHLPRTVARHSA